MPKLRAILSMLRAPLIADRADRDLALELDAHLQMLAEEQIRRGVPPEEARRLVRIALGSVECTRENCHDARGSRWISDLSHDLRFALRALRHQPGFAAIALLTLALGVGTTTMIFTLVNTVLLKPLGYPDSDRIVMVHSRTPRSSDRVGFSYPDYTDLARESHSYTAIAAWTGGGSTISEPGEPQYVGGIENSSQLLSALEVQPARGRGFLSSEDRPGGAPVAIISYRLWRQLFGGSPGAIGARLVFNGRARTVVGALAAGFQLNGTVDVLTPLGQDTTARMRNRAAPILQVLALLRPGATISQAQAEFTIFGRRLSQQYPNSNKDISFVLHPLREEVVGDVRSMEELAGASLARRRFLHVLFGIFAALALLLACIGICGVLAYLTRRRVPEIGVRMALGASARDVVRLILRQSLTMILAGAAAGLAAVIAAARLLERLVAGVQRIDPVAAALMMAILLCAALAASFIPARRANRIDPMRTLRQE